MRVKRRSRRRSRAASAVAIVSDALVMLVGPGSNAIEMGGDRRGRGRRAGSGHPPTTSPPSTFCWPFRPIGSVSM